MAGWLIVVFAAVLTAWYFRRSVRTVPAFLDLESSHETFHAHADLGMVLVDEGDAVLIHDAPNRIAFGEKRRIETKATVAKASWLRRCVVRVLGTSHITELYEVGFEG